jgi:hypothetical protein
MSTPFGAQLIGQTEKTLNALLDRALVGTDLTEPLWVSLRITQQLAGAVDADGLADSISDRALYDDASGLVAELSARGLVDGGRLTPAGLELVGRIQERTTALTANLWSDLPEDDLAVAGRVLTTVLERGRAMLVA